MINIRNTQKLVPLKLKVIKKELKAILQILGYEDFDLGVWFCSEKTIRTYNRDYRQKDKVTDVLSFPFYPNLKAGDKIKPLCNDDKNLGDLIICPIYVFKDSQKFNKSFEEHLQLMFVHGICHLLGYDHIIDSDFKKMRIKEASIIKQLKKY